ncbi:MAG TPA: esterase-like activity of phytase family protein [Polyangium sp.]|nr:esterase-like activity of phytase family protein [Polyangium sp.]
MRIRQSIPMVAIWLAGALMGCSRKTDGSLPAGGRLVAMNMQDLAGLSGLARDDGGTFYAVPEEDRMLLELSAAGQEQRRYRVNGVPEGVEFESLAWLGKDRFAVGTEGGCKEGAEHVLVLAREGDAVKVAKDIAVPLNDWGMACDDKRGIEGLCAAGGKIVGAVENPLPGKEDPRLAAIARIDETTGEVTAYRLALTSKSGKISALDCRVKDGAIEILAIERHFEVSRLLTFTIPLSGAAEEAPRTAKIVKDLLPYANDGKRNFEGVVWLDNQRAMLIVDNKYGKITGPNEMMEVEIGAAP